MSTVNNTLAIISAYDAWQVAEQKAVDLVKGSKAKLVDLVIATLGVKPSYDDTIAFRTDFVAKLQDKGLTLEASNKRYTRMMQVVKADERFEMPKAPSADAERMRQSRSEYANLNEAEIQDKISEALANKDYKVLAKIGAEQEKREKALKRADEQKDKVYLKDLAERIKGLDMATARLVAWVLVEKNMQQVKALIKSQAK